MVAIKDLVDKITSDGSAHKEEHKVDQRDYSYLGSTRLAPLGHV